MYVATEVVIGSDWIGVEPDSHKVIPQEDYFTPTVEEILSKDPNYAEDERARQQMVELLFEVYGPQSNKDPHARLDKEVMRGKIPPGYDETVTILVQRYATPDDQYPEYAALAYGRTTRATGEFVWLAYFGEQGAARQAVVDYFAKHRGAFQMVLFPTRQYAKAPPIYAFDGLPWTDSIIGPDRTVRVHILDLPPPPADDDDDDWILSDEEGAGDPLGFWEGIGRRDEDYVRGDRTVSIYQGDVTFIGAEAYQKVMLPLLQKFVPPLAAIMGRITGMRSLKQQLNVEGISPDRPLEFQFLWVRETDFFMLVARADDGDTVVLYHNNPNLLSVLLRHVDPENVHVLVWERGQEPTAISADYWYIRRRLPAYGDIPMYYYQPRAMEISQDEDEDEDALFELEDDSSSSGSGGSSNWGSVSSSSKGKEEEEEEEEEEETRPQWQPSPEKRRGPTSFAFLQENDNWDKADRFQMELRILRNAQLPREQVVLLLQSLFRQYDFPWQVFRDAKERINEGSFIPTYDFDRILARDSTRLLLP